MHRELQIHLFFRGMVAAILLLVFPLPAQPLFPGTSGEALIDSLTARYRPSATLGYSAAREIMFSEIDNHNDSVTCVYTGYRIYLNHNDPEPIQAAYNQDVDTEHTWPQSLGASGQAKSDLHHLFPSWRAANSDRGNKEFHEIPDPSTDRWFRLNHYQATIPAQWIDQYSEVDFDTESFEVREDHKGNTARAMFYFQTMYRGQTVAGFFDAQKQELLQWHRQDPADSAETARTLQIAMHQQGKPNPFVLDSTLAVRAFFPALALPQDKREISISAGWELLPAYPNPFNSRVNLTVQFGAGGPAELRVYNPAGQQLYSQQITAGPAGIKKFSLNAEGWPGGIYFIELRHAGGRQVQKIILMK
ncbi:MAG: endonuclease [Calditrichia bacterium]